MTSYMIDRALLLESRALPRFASPAQVDIGDVVKIDGEPLPVVIVGGTLEDVHHVFTWVSVARRSDGMPVAEGRGVHDVGERMVLLAYAETVTASEINDGDLLVFSDRATAYGVVVGEPRESRPGVLDIAWRSSRLPNGMPQTIGFLQRDPSDMLRRAPRGWAS